MKNRKKMGLRIIMVMVISLIGFITMNAAGTSCTLGFAGNGTTNAELNKNVTINVAVKNVVGQPVAGINARLNYDKTYLKLVSATGMLTPYTVDFNEVNNKFVGLSTAGKGISNNTNILTLVFTPLKEGSTTLSITDPDLGDVPGDAVNTTLETHTVNIGPAKSTNSFAGSLTVTGHTYTPAFNKNTTSYNLSVGNEVTSVTVAATCEDPKATLSWASGKAGENTLKEGNNTISFVCTSEAGGSQKRTYTLTVNRASAAKPQSSSFHQGNSASNSKTCLI